jgi:hypothetical protein
VAGSACGSCHDKLASADTPTVACLILTCGNGNNRARQPVLGFLKRFSSAAVLHLDPAKYSFHDDLAFADTSNVAYLMCRLPDSKTTHGRALHSPALA